MLLHGMLLDGPNGQPMIFSVVQDISEIKRIEQELRDAVEAQRAACYRSGTNTKRSIRWKTHSE